MLEDLRLFLLIVERRGMAAAGRELGLAPSTVSARLAAMEERFGVRLLHRTTRALSPTSEGLVLLEGARRVLAEVQELDARVRLGAERLAGPIRLSAPQDLGRNWLVPLLDDFIEAHPDVRLELHLSDGYVDLSASGFDLALRYGALVDHTLRMRKLADVRRVIVASPAYIARRGAPERPEALEDHNCLLMRFEEEPDRHWPFLIEGQTIRVTVRGDRTANDGELVRRWCLAGHGIARKSEADVREDLDAGRLVALLTDAETSPVALQLVYPGGRAPSRRVRMLIDRIAEARETLGLTRR